MKSLTGFTLIELLIAIVIFTLISAMAYGSLNSVLMSHQTITKQQQQFQTLSKTSFQLQRELRHIVPRPVTDSFNTVVPALKLEQGDKQVLFSFTRMGVPNLAGIAKSPLQRIEYIFSDKTLKKRTWISVDSNDEGNFKEQILLEDLQQFKVEAMAKNSNWYQNWPNEQDPIDLLPFAVRVIFVTIQYGEISYLLNFPQ